jgi:hypothetical protein
MQINTKTSKTSVRVIPECRIIIVNSANQNGRRYNSTKSGVWFSTNIGADPGCLPLSHCFVAYGYAQSFDKYLIDLPRDYFINRAVFN